MRREKVLREEEINREAGMGRERGDNPVQKARSLEIIKRERDICT